MREMRTMEQVEKERYAAALRAYRAVHKLKQDDINNVLDIHIREVSYLETGKFRYVSDESFEKIKVFLQDFIDNWRP